jgi:integrase
LSYTGKTRKACQDWIKRTVQKIDGGMSYNGSKITVGQFISEWLTMKEATLRPGTFKQYCQIANDYIILELGKIRLINLGSEQIQHHYNNMIGDGIGLRTIELTHAVLRGCLNHAVKLNILSRNPTIATIPPKPKPSEKTVLDESQIQALMIAAQTLQPVNAPLYQLALTTGMRVGEILGLKWEDIDFGRKTLNIKRQLNRDPKRGFYFPPPKTKAGIRSVSLGHGITSVLLDHKQRQLQRQMSFLPKWVEIDLVFTEDDGSPIRYNKLIRHFKDLLQKAGLPKMRFHDLRHTAATHMLINGVDILTVAKRLGHSKTSVTLDTYGHLIPGVQEKAAYIMDEITTPVTLFTQETAPKLHQE